jgi:hypothetical protein
MYACTHGVLLVVTGLARLGFRVHIGLVAPQHEAHVFHASITQVLILSGLVADWAEMVGVEQMGHRSPPVTKWRAGK